VDIFLVIKQGRRRRYIGFKIINKKNNVFSKRDMINAIRYKSIKDHGFESKEMKIFLVRFNGTSGIVRCSHIKKDETINFLKSIDEINNKNVKIETLGTSCTIKSLIKKHMAEL